MSNETTLPERLMDRLKSYTVLKGEEVGGERKKNAGT
jgi:hypothetical protein